MGPFRPRSSQLLLGLFVWRGLAHQSLQLGNPLLQRFYLGPGAAQYFQLEFELFPRDQVETGQHAADDSLHMVVHVVLRGEGDAGYQLAELLMQRIEQSIGRQCHDDAPIQRSPYSTRSRHSGRTLSREFGPSISLKYQRTVSVQSQ